MSTLESEAKLLAVSTRHVHPAQMLGCGLKKRGAYKSLGFFSFHVSAN